MISPHIAMNYQISVMFAIFFDQIMAWGARHGSSYLGALERSGLPGNPSL
jgi:hypothetical protein